MHFVCILQRHISVFYISLDINETEESVEVVEHEQEVMMQ